MKVTSLIISSLFSFSMFAQAEGPCRSMTETIATKTGQYVRKINNSKKEVVPNKEILILYGIMNIKKEKNLHGNLNRDTLG